MKFKIAFLRCNYYDNIFYHYKILTIMLSKLNNYKYNNICNNFIKIITPFSMNNGSVLRYFYFFIYSFACKNKYLK